MPIDKRSRTTFASPMVLMAMVLASCATEPFQPLVAELLGQNGSGATANERSPAPTSQATRSGGNDCGHVGFAIPTDVDSVYARVMSRLHFRTLDERKRFAEEYSSGLMDEAFRHTAQPGSYYRLADLVGWRAPTGVREAAWLEVELTRDGPSRTRFAGKYCLSRDDPHVADRSFRNALEKRLRDSVK